MEAENFSSKTTVGGQEWLSLADGTASNGEGMRVMPDLGNGGESASNLPVINYTVRFVTPGTYNVWVRGRSLTGTPASANSNSVHVGVDGTYSTADRISGFGTSWSWYRTTLDGPTSTVVIGAAGTHTINVKMREDGFAFDKIYLTIAGAAPTGAGPAESALSEPGFVEQGGILSVEAENASANTAGVTDSWQAVSELAASGGNALQSAPDDGTAYVASAIASSPLLSFEVTMTQSGVYDVWVRGRAGGASRTASDSVHVGLNGTLPATSDDISFFGTTYSWQRRTPSGNAQITIPSAGSHRIDVWMREDGFIVDKLVLSLASLGYVPTGFGPPESSTVQDPCADGLQNGAETDVDCGGTCAGCAVGEACGSDSDCGSGKCDVVLSECIPAATCEDGIQNQTETGVDCGGSCDACSLADVPFAESAGTVVIEAESAAATYYSGTGPSWQVGSSPLASGNAYLEASPDANATIEPVSSRSPRADYPVLFATAGTYNVYVRGAAAGSSVGTSDSVHVGLDGVALASSDRITGFNTTYGWRTSTQDGVNATINVATPGLHAVNLWIREDGFRADKIVLTLGSAPTGTGPIETVRGNVNVSSGIGEHSCALVSNGTIVCWGSNDYGQLGNGNTNDQPDPVEAAYVGMDSVQVSAGGWHTCTLREDGTVWCWGRNDEGQLGDGTIVDSTAPVQVLTAAATPLTDVVEIGSGGLHTCARTAAGNVRCWGYNQLGQLGNNSTTSSSYAVLVTTTVNDVPSTYSGVSSLEVGGWHNCVVLSGGSVTCWGDGTSGQLGNGANVKQLEPVSVTGLTSVAALGAGEFHTCALASGAIRCWGYNEYEQLGDGTTTLRNTHVAGPVVPNAISLSGGFGHTCARTSAGSVFCWGDNFFGQLGNNSNVGGSAAVQVSGLDSFSMDAGGLHSCSLNEQGGIACWGYNASGQLGDGSTDDSWVPVPVNYP
jgi:alpha-tubulin suppressor-like RCC1 family protein